MITLHIIFSVVGTYELYPTTLHLHLGGFVFTPTRTWWARCLHGNSRLESTQRCIGIQFQLQPVNKNHKVCVPLECIL